MLTGLTIPVIDLSKGSQDVTFIATARDEGGGSGVDFIALTLDTMVAGLYGRSPDIYLHSGSTAWPQLLTSFSEQITVTRGTPPGVHTILQALVFDRAGNVASYGTAQLKALGLPTSVTVLGSPMDMAGPILTGLSLPPAVDFSKGWWSSKVTASADDGAGGSGIDQVVLNFSSPLLGSHGQFTRVVIGDPQAFLDDDFNDATPGYGSWDMSLSPLNAPGRYALQSASVYDKAGNVTQYYDAQLRAMGINTTLEIVDGTAGVSAEVEQDSVWISVHPARYVTGASDVSLTLTYDATAMHYRSFSASNEPWAAGITASSTEIGGIGTLTISGHAKLAYPDLSFLGLRFESSGASATYTISNYTLNGVQQALGAAASGSVLLGGAGTDQWSVGAGVVHVDGGAGVDTVAFAGVRTAYRITPTENLPGYFDVAGPGLQASLAHVERLVFGDHAVALDTDGAGGQVYRLYQAAFNRAPDQAGLGYWIAQMEHGMALQEVASGFVHSAEFAMLYGGSAPDPLVYVQQLYLNILHRAPERDGYAYWYNEMVVHGQSREQVLVGFSESAENQAQLIGSMRAGMDYIPYG